MLDNVEHTEAWRLPLVPDNVEHTEAWVVLVERKLSVVAQKFEVQFQLDLVELFGTYLRCMLHLYRS